MIMAREYMGAEVGQNIKVGVLGGHISECALIRFRKEIVQAALYTHSHTLTHTLTHSLTHSLTPSHTHSLTHSLTHTHIQERNCSGSPVYTLTHTHSYTHSLTHTLTHSLTHIHTYTHTHHTHPHTRTVSMNICDLSGYEPVKRTHLAMSLCTPCTVPTYPVKG